MCLYDNGFGPVLMLLRILQILYIVNSKFIHIYLQGLKFVHCCAKKVQRQRFVIAMVALSQVLSTLPPVAIGSHSNSQFTHILSPV